MSGKYRPRVPLTVQIEQAIARGHTHEKIVADLHVDNETVAQVQARLDKLAAESDYEIHDQPLMYPDCGSHAAFNRHKDRSEDPDEACVAGERAYQAARHQRRRGRAA